MSSWDTLLIAFAVCSAVCVAEPNRIIVKHQFGVPTTLRVDSYSNTTVLYSVCEVLGRPNEVCDVVLETSNFDITTKTSSCQVNMNPHYKTLESAQVGADKAIFVQIRMDPNTRKPIKNSFKFTYVDFEGCKIKDFDIPMVYTFCDWDIEYVVVIRREHSFDIIIIPKSSVCNQIFYQTIYLDGHLILPIVIGNPFYRQNTNERCKLKDNEVSIEDQSHQENINERFIRHIKFHYYINGQVWSNNTADLVLVLKNEKLLKAWNIPNADDQRQIINSISYNTVGVCLQESNAVANCTQFDVDGNRKLEIILEYSDEAVLAMYNLPEGFLMLTKKCMNGTFDNCQKFNYYVKHFDGSGRTVNAVPIQFDDFQWIPVKNSIMFDFFEDKFGAYCISLLNFDRGIQFFPRMRPARLELTAQCFSNL